MSNPETKEEKGFLQKIPGFRSGVWWKKILAIVGYLFMFLLVVSLFQPGTDIEKQTEKDDIIQSQQSEIDNLKDTVKNLEDQVAEFKKDPTVAFREAMESNDKDVIAAFAGSFPDQEDLVNQAHAKIAKIEAEEKVAEAKRKAEEEAAKKKQEQELKERGTLAGNGFYYKNVGFKDSYGMMDVIGEMRNESGEDWGFLPNFLQDVAGN